jgi:hypothetical protein
MLDHVVISVPANRLEQVANWYLAALAPIGYAKQREYPGMAVGLGPNKDLAPFWIGVKEEAAIAATHRFSQQRSLHSRSILRGSPQGWREVQRETWTEANVSSGVLWCFCIGPNGVDSSVGALFRMAYNIQEQHRGGRSRG